MKIQIASHSPFLVESHDGRSKKSKMKFSVHCEERSVCLSFLPTIIVITTLSARTTTTPGETLCVKREAGQTELSYSGSSEQRSEQARGRIMSDFLLDE